MLPYFFSMNHYLYARGVSLYLQDMLQLPNIVMFDLNRGMMSVKRKEGIFNGVGSDLALEQSQNRSSAISGGLIGITQNEHAMQRWILLYPLKNSIHLSFLSFCDLHDDDPANDIRAFSHHEWSPSQIKRDDTDVDIIVNNLKSKNIFDNMTGCTSLFNISNGQFASEETSKYLLSLKENGENLLQSFMEERIIRKDKSIFDRVPRVLIKNFTYTENTKLKNENSKELKETKELMDIQQLLMLCVQREYSVDSLAKYELLNYPKALADTDGFYKKSVKSVLMEEIEKETLCTVTSMTSFSSLNSKIHLFDGMTVVHRLQLSKHATFGEFATTFFNYVTSYFKKPKVTRVDIIFDRYDNQSIKFLESALRAKNIKTCEIVIQGPNTKIPKNISTFLTSPKNKLELVRFLCQNILQYVSLTDDQDLIISGGFDNVCKCFSIQG